MGLIIYPPQNAFVRGRQLLNSSLIANECIDFWVKSKIKGVACHVDMKKAYDHVNWEFLDWVLEKMGFGRKWRFWMQVCISIASYFVLMNGSPIGFEKGSRGSRQVDPLSPFLFNVAMEVLCSMVNRVVECDAIQGCVFPQGDPIVYLLQFADDSLFFLKPQEDMIRNLRCLLLMFEAVSSLKVNLQKSKMMGVGDVESFNHLAGILECRVVSLPVTYLGLPLGGNQRKADLWDPVVEKIQHRLALWKGRYLSKGGKVTLIKSALANLPVYSLSLFKAPASILKKLEDFRKDFLSGAENGERRFHLVSWKRVCKPLEAGGLGIRDLKIMNRALLAKWLWRFRVETEALWRKVIAAKYGCQQLGWSSRVPSGSLGSRLRRSIFKENDVFQNLIEYRVGQGNHVLFWHHVWCGALPLKQAFPVMFNMATHKDWTMEEHIVRDGDSKAWNLHLRRTINDWDVPTTSCLLSRLERVPIANSADDDFRFWPYESKGLFTVKSMCSVWDPVDLRQWPFDFIWGSKVPSKLRFFLWLLFLGKALTHDNLANKGVPIVGRGCMCKRQEETLSHLFLHCPFAF